MPSDGSAASRIQRFSIWIFAAASGAYWAFQNVPTWVAHITHDAGWDIYAANAVLHGVQLNGPHLVEVDPPFLVWFFTLPVLLARVLHISLPTGFHLFEIVSTTALIAWSAMLYRRVCRSSLLSTWMFVLAMMYVATGPVSLEDRGQREYFVAFLLLPYVLWTAARLRGELLPRAQTLLLAVFAVVAVCLKPQHVIDIVAVELLVLIRMRSFRAWWRPALLLLVLGPVVYVFCVWLFNPAYFRDVVPLLRDTYWGFDRPWSVVLRGMVKPSAALGTALLLYVILRRRLRTEPFVAVLLAISAGALAAYLQQHKGWSYHVLVLQIFSYLAIAVVCLDIAERMAFERRGILLLAGTNRVYTTALVSVALVAFLITGKVRVAHMQAIDYPQKAKSELASIYSAYPPGTPVDLLAVDAWEWPEVLEQNKVWSSRYNHLWLLPAIVRSQDPLDPEVAHHLSSAKIDTLSTLLRQTVAEDLEYWHPSVVVIDPCGEVVNICGGLSRAGYSGLLDWFSRNPQFREEWSHYRYQKTVGQMQVYTRIG